MPNQKNLRHIANNGCSDPPGRSSSSHVFMQLMSPNKYAMQDYVQRNGVCCITLDKTLLSRATLSIRTAT